MFIKKYLKWISTFLVLVGILLTKYISFEYIFSWIRSSWLDDLNI